MGGRSRHQEAMEEQDGSWAEPTTEPMVDNAMPDIKRYPLFCSTRMTMALVLFLGYVMVYSLRVNLSVGMVCMVNHTAVGLLEREVSPNATKLASVQIARAGGGSCGRLINETQAIQQDGPMVWPKDLQGIALSAFFWGYIVTQVPGGWLAAKYGAKVVLFLALGGSSALTLLMPLAARLNFTFFVSLRVVMGILQGMVFPASHVLWTHWAPPMERSRLVGFSYAGAQIGNVIAMPLSGLLCVYGFDGGWPSVFYIFGAIGLAWCLLWMVFGASSPQEHRCISMRERDFIEMVLEGQVSEKTPPTPWLKILSSMPVWAITVANITGDFGIYVFLTNLPTYMKENLGFSAEMSGLVSALPYIGFWAMMNVSAFIADKLIESKILSVTVTRKLFNGIGIFIPAVMLVILTTFGCEWVWMAVALLTIGVSFCGVFYGAGFLVNHSDIAPQFAGILMGISNGTGTLSGMFAPALVGVMTQQRTAEQWKNVFYMTSAIMTLGGIFYCIFASGEVQSWATDNQEKPLQELVDADDVEGQMDKV